MANSTQYGAFGLLRKSIGSVVYSRSKDGKGRTIQVARSKPVTVANPNTIGQILQRCKISPATRFYNAMVTLLDHSWEGVAYEQQSRQHFMELALKLQGPFIPKSVTEVIPADYPISEGSLPNLIASPVAAEGTALASAQLTAENVAALIAAGVPEGAQLTIVAWFKTASGSYDFAYGRIINAVGNIFAWTKSTAANMTVNLVNGVFHISYANGRETVAVGAILSKFENGAWKRSTQNLVLDDDYYEGLYNAAARQLTVESYQTGGDINKINSAWYLNLANGQPWPGQLSVINNVPLDDAEPGTRGNVIEGTMATQDGDFTYTIFTDDGTAAGKLIMVADGQIVQGTAEQTAFVLSLSGRLYGDRVNQWMDVYATQLGF